MTRLALRCTQVTGTTVAALLSLAGCDGLKTDPPSAGPALAGFSAEEILDRATTAMKGLSSVTFMTVDTGDGVTSRGWTTMTNDRKCVSHYVARDIAVDIITIGRFTYERGGLPAAEKDPDGSDDRWAKSYDDPADDEGDGTDDTCDVRTFMTSLLKEMGPVKTKRTPLTINGREAIPVASQGRTGTTTLYIATQGKPYVLRLDQTGDGGGSADFGDFDKPVTIEAPPAAETDDLDAIP